MSDSSPTAPDAKLAKGKLLGLTPVQWVILAIILGGAGYLSFWGFGQIFGKEEASASRQLFPVRRGDIAETVSTNGSVAYATRETLTFGAPGTVGNIAVTEGQTVAKDAVIATLDSGTLSTLNRAIKEAELSARTAEEKVSALQEPADALVMAQADADLITAQNALKDAEKATDVALVRALADADAALSAAQTKFDDLSAPSAAAIAVAVAEVTQAKAAVKTAEDNLASVSGGVAMTRASDNLRTAQQSLANVQVDYSVASKSRDDKVSTAKTSLDDAQTKYRSTFMAWTGVRPDATQIAKDPQELIASWGTTYDLLIKNAAADSGPLIDNPATPWNEQILYLWTHLLPVPVVGACSTPVASTMRCMQGEIETTWKAVATTSTAYDTAVSQQATLVNAARNAVTKAEDALDAAKRTVDELSDATTLQARNADVSVARSRLVVAQDKLTTASKVDTVALAAAKAQLDEIKAKLATAKDFLARGAEGRKTNIALAKARIASAVDKLADLRAVGKDTLAIALAQAQLSEANARLKLTQDTLAGATIRAPFAGVVGAFSVDEGQSVGVNTAVVEIVDRSVLVVNAVVDEIDVLSIGVNAAASITMDALSGRVLQGTVSEIGEAANSQNGVVNYPIEVKITVPQGLSLREGLSATASVTIRSEQNALLVPVQAVGGSFTRPTVILVRGGKEQITEVQLGISDESWVAVLLGIQDGDQVVIENSTTAVADTRLQRQGQLGQGQLLGGSTGQGQNQIFIAPGGGQFGGQGAGGQRQQPGGRAPQPGGTQRGGR
ncbi:MAG: efflux RND transporter periplasmic adaptor subunit [Dehalococcoidia bacterium]|nr:efflux RND transporter periplasmic adaptor subunit [Dehalococcoidia bacterium]